MILMLDLKETYFSNKNFIYGAFFKTLCYKVLYESGITFFPKQFVNRAVATKLVLLFQTHLLDGLLHSSLFNSHHWLKLAQDLSDLLRRLAV